MACGDRSCMLRPDDIASEHPSCNRGVVTAGSREAGRSGENWGDQELVKRPEERPVTGRDTCWTRGVVSTSPG